MHKILGHPRNDRVMSVTEDLARPGSHWDVRVRLKAANNYDIESGVAPANQAKERSVHELFAGAFRNKCSM